MTSRRVLVTGGTEGAGIGVTRALLDAGYQVVTTWIVEGEFERARSALGGRAELRRVDVRRPEEVEAVVRESDDTGGLWGLVHLVGGYRDGDPVARMDLDGLDRQLELNLRTLAVAMRAALPGMVAHGGGRVVAVSSRAAVAPFAGGGAYAASKAGVIALVQAAAQEVKGNGVCVNCLLPSVVDTPANRSAMPDADHSSWVSPDELGAVVRFLVSPESSGVTGAAIPVYGRV